MPGNNPILTAYPGKVVSIDSDVSVSFKFYTPKRANKESIDQKVIQYVGMLSNCNVSIQHFVNGGYSARYRLFCESCAGWQEITDLDILDGLRKGIENTVTESLRVFCNNHRHDSTTVIIVRKTTNVEEAVGRKYREE